MYQYSYEILREGTSSVEVFRETNITCRDSYTTRHLTGDWGLISIYVRLLKMHIFENVLLSTRRPYGRIIMNLFRKLKLSCTCSNSTSLPLPHSWNKTRVKPPSDQTSPAHAPYAQQFLSVNVSNRAAQCQNSWPARYVPQATTRFTCLVFVPFEHEPSKSECR